MKKILITCCLVSYFLISCAGIPKEVRDAFTYCYDNSYTGIDTLININGYYKEMNFVKRDTFYINFLFFDNGMYIANIDTSFIKEALDVGNNNEKKGFYDYLNWGRYIIDGDIIKVQTIHKKVSWNDNWSGWEKWYKIINKNEIRYINSFPLILDEKERESIRSFYLSSWLESTGSSFFVPVIEIPNPYKSWILKEKWFWCNELDWKDYMNKIKKKKQEK